MEMPDDRPPGPARRDQRPHRRRREAMERLDGERPTGEECETIARVLTTDDPAAVAAIAAQWWERHRDAVLDAGVAAGVLEAENNAVNLPCGCFVHINSLHPCGDERPPKRRLVTVWREVEQP